MHDVIEIAFVGVPGQNRAMPNRRVNRFTIFSAAIVGAMLGAPAVVEAQQTSSPPPAPQTQQPAPARGGFDLENLGRPSPPVRRGPQAQGPVDPEAPVATQPRGAARPGRTAQTQPVAPSPTGQVSAPGSQIAISPVQSSRPGARVADRARAPRQIADPSAGVSLPSSGTLPNVNPGAATIAGAPLTGGPAPDAPDFGPILTAPTSSGAIPWAWLIAALLVAGGLGYVFYRRAPRWQPEVGMPFQAAQPLPPKPANDAAPSASPAVRRASTAPMPVEAHGLALTFVPDYAAASFARIAVRYALTLTNLTDRDLENVSVRALFASADANQQATVERFFGGAGGRVAHVVERIAAGETVELAGELAMPLAETRPLRYGTRLLLVPIAAFDAGFVQGAKTSKLSAAFMVGIEPNQASDKMGPLRLDLGPKTFSHVGQRPLAFAKVA